MPKFRKSRSPERQAEAVIGRLVNLGALRRNPDRPASVRTVANYRDCLLQVARRIADDGRELRDLTPRDRRGLSQKPHRRSRPESSRHAPPGPAGHARPGRLPNGERLTVVRSLKPWRKGGRVYTPQQIRMVAAAQRGRNGLSTLIAHAAGLRAHEFFTLARPDEQPPDARPARSEKFAGRPGRDYTVVGKGGLVRLVRIPDDLAERLEAHRRDEPVRVTDRGIHYTSRYDIAAGTAWGASFTGASKRALGWTRGAHGARHAYAQERMRELQRILTRRDALEAVSQELGHFRPDITEAYLK